MLVLGMRGGCRLDRHVMARDVKLLCKKLGVDPQRALCTHSATPSRSTISGAEVQSSSCKKCFGHSSLEMTRRYANPMTEDLQAIHQRVSLLGT
jgi:integrase/recombinase XerD